MPEKPVSSGYACVEYKTGEASPRLSVDVAGA